MTEEQLRALWEKRVSTKEKELLDWLWHYFAENYQDYIRDALQEPRFVADLVDLAEPLIATYRLGSERPKPPGRKAHTVVEVQVTDYERKCADVLSPYLAKLATSLPSVQRFREEEFGDNLLRLLSPKQAVEFLRQEAFANLPDPEEFEGFGKFGPTYEGIVRWLQRLGKDELLEHVIPSDLPRPSAAQDLFYPILSKGFAGMWLRPGEEEGVGRLGKLSVRLAMIFP